MIKTKIVRRRNYRNLVVFGLGIFVAVFLFVFLAQKFGKTEGEANAANLASFNPGYIISDFQMTDYTSMSEADIQNFLWSKGRCYNTNFSGVGARVDYFSDHTPPTTWHVINGHTVCLAEENMNGESAAHIIWQAAQDYRINPKVLLVLIQKETGLITDPIPNSWDYQRTAGYGCPDTAACSEKYYGFKNQIRNAAYLFRIVMDGNSSYYPIGYNNMRYSPDPNCGSSTVYIQNLATSALYRYTPYQPNAGALAAGYGTAPCGAYGNRNFFAYFEDWFGGITDDGVAVPRSDVLAEGRYKIVSALSDKRVLDVDGEAAAVKNGTNVYIYDNRDVKKQEWQVERNGDGTYTFINIVSGKVLDVEGGSKDAGANVQMFSSNGTCAQRWNVTRNTDGTYTMYSNCSGLALDVSGGSTSNGANIQLYVSNATPAQKWKLVPLPDLEDGEYVVNSKLSNNMVIDLAGGVGGANNGKNIQIFNENNTLAQTWKFIRGSDNYYTIKNPATGMVLDVAGGSTSNGGNVQLYSSNNTCAQKWQVVKNTDGTYTISSSCSGLALDVAGGNAGNGANIQIFSPNRTNAQKWALSKLNIIEDGTYKIGSDLIDNFVIGLAKDTKIATSGTNVEMKIGDKSTGQKWKVKYDDGGYYEIINSDTGLAVDVAGGGTQNGTNIHVWETNKTCAQKWRIIKNTDGTYTILSSCSGLALDVAGGNTADGANLWIFTPNATPAQKWKMVKQ